MRARMGKVGKSMSGVYHKCIPRNTYTSFFLPVEKLKDALNDSEGWFCKNVEDHQCGFLPFDGVLT